MRLAPLSLVLALLAQRSPVSPGGSGDAGRSGGPDVEGRASSAVETFTVSAAFRLTEGGASPRKPVAGIEVELGVGVSGGSPRFRDAPVLARSRSDAEGNVEVELDVPVSWRDEPEARVWARVSEPGYRCSSAHRALSGSVVMNLIVRPGGTIFGAALGEAGEPVPGARVVVLDPAGSATMYASTDHAGRFAVDVWDREVGVVHVRAPGVGSAWRAVEGSLDEAVELVPGGGFELRGRVLDPAQEPVPGALVSVRATGGTGPLSAQEAFALEQSGGLVRGAARTDADGRFRIAGLAPVGLDVYCTWRGPVPGELRPWRDLGERITSVTPDARGESLELVVPMRRLEVRLLDEGGRSIAPMIEVDPGDSAERELKPGVLAARSEGGRLPATPRFETPVAVDDLAVFPIDGKDASEALEYVIVPTLPERALGERRVELPRDAYRAQASVELEPECAPAALVFRVLEPSGVDYRFPFLVAYSASTGQRCSGTIAPDEEEREATGKAFWRTELRPGTYELAVDTTPPIAGGVDCFQPPEVWPRELYCGERWSVTLEPGEVLRIEHRLGPAGHLDLVPLQEARGESPEILEATEAARRQFGGCPVVLEGDDGTTLRPRFELPTGAIFPRFEWVLPGRPARGLTAIPPGRWTLRIANVDGTELLERSIEIVEGQVTTVRW